MTAPAPTDDAPTKAPADEKVAAETPVAKADKEPAATTSPSTLGPTGSPTSTLAGPESQTTKTTTNETSVAEAGSSLGNKREAVAISTASAETTKKEAPNKKAKTEVPCLAAKFGFQDGDRIEVEWDLSNPGSDDVETHWWAATLLPYDGTSVVDGVAVRHIRYDPYPQKGYLEASTEPVIFLSTNCLCDPETRTPMNFRSEGGEEIIALDEQELETTVNSILDRALAKNQAAWSTMSAAQQAQIASKVAAKKQKLIQLMREHKGDISTDIMKDLLAQTMSA